MKYSLLFIAITALLSCKKYEPELGDAPTSKDTEFSATPATTSSPNNIELSTTNQTILCQWDFGNGSTATGNNVTASYPYAGTYTITLTVFNKGGSKSASKEVTIAADDLGLLNNPIYTMLTGGTSGTGSKTWYLDSTAVGHMGVGPDPESALGSVPEWWAAGDGDKGGVGLYDDRYVFSLNGFGFDMITQGEVYVHNTLASNFPGSYENAGDYTAPLPDQIGETWLLTEGDENTITISNNAFIGFYTGVQTYRILEMTDSTMSLQYKHHEGGFNWYLKLKSI